MFRSILSWISNRPWAEGSLLFIGLAAAAIIGAIVSKLVRGGAWIGWTFGAGSISLAVWAYQSKYSKMSLTTSSVVFDVIYNGMWFVTLLLLGEQISPMQGVGIALTVIGVALLGL